MRGREVKCWAIKSCNGIGYPPVLYYNKKFAQEICKMHKLTHGLKRNTWKPVRVSITEVKPRKKNLSSRQKGK